jgi:hypothetical protein
MAGGLIEWVKGNGEDDGERMERANGSGGDEEAKKGAWVIETINIVGKYCYMGF